MEEYFARLAITSGQCLCVGSITAAEAERARSDGIDVDGYGYYVFLADESDPSRPIEILAKFVSLAAAERIARLIAEPRPETALRAS